MYIVETYILNMNGVNSTRDSC